MRSCCTNAWVSVWTAFGIVRKSALCTNASKAKSAEDIDAVDGGEQVSGLRSIPTSLACSGHSLPSGAIGPSLGEGFASVVRGDDGAFHAWTSAFWTGTRPALI